MKQCHGLRKKLLLFVEWVCYNTYADKFERYNLYARGGIYGNIKGKG